MPMLCSWVPLVAPMAVWFAAVAVELWRAGPRELLRACPQRAWRLEAVEDVMVWRKEKPARVLVSSISHRIGHCTSCSWARSRAVDTRTRGAERALRKLELGFIRLARFNEVSLPQPPAPPPKVQTAPDPASGTTWPPDNGRLALPACSRWPVPLMTFTVKSR